MAGDLLGGEHRFKLADEVGGADDPLAQAAQELDRPSVHHRHIHDGVIGRVLHGQGARARQHRLQASGQLLPARIEPLDAGQRVQPALLDAMHQLARLARGGHKVVPAPRDVGLLVQAEDAPGDGVAVMMVVEEPAVEAGLADCRLNRF